MTQITPLAFALYKRSLQGVILAWVDEQEGEVSEEAIVAYLRSQGFDADEKKINSSIQSLATNGKLDRGLAKAHYAKAGTIDPEERAAAKALRSENAKKASVEPRERKPRTPRESKVYTNEEVFTYLIEQLGEPVQLTKGLLGPSFVLLGDASGEYILERSKRAYNADPTAWTVFQVGENTAVMFLA